MQSQDLAQVIRAPSAGAISELQHVSGRLPGTNWAIVGIQLWCHIPFGTSFDYLVIQWGCSCQDSNPPLLCQDLLTWPLKFLSTQTYTFNSLKSYLLFSSTTKCFFSLNCIYKYITVIIFFFFSPRQLTGLWSFFHPSLFLKLKAFLFSKEIESLPLCIYHHYLWPLGYKI